MTLPQDPKPYLRAVETPEFGSTPMGGQVGKERREDSFINTEPSIVSYDLGKVRDNLDKLAENNGTDHLAILDRIGEGEGKIQEIGNGLMELGLAVNERLAKQADARSEGLRSAMKLIGELRADVMALTLRRDRLTSLESPAFEKWMASVNARLDELEARPDAPETTEQAEDVGLPSDASFLRYITKRYQLPRFVSDSLFRIADEIERGQRRPM